MIMSIKIIVTRSTIITLTLTTVGDDYPYHMIIIITTMMIRAIKMDVIIRIINDTTAK